MKSNRFNPYPIRFIPYPSMMGNNRYTGQGSKFRPNGTFTVTTNKRKKGSSGSGVTSQYDRKVQYVKKTMPRKKKRRWVRFVKKVNAVALKQFGTKTIVRNSQASVNWTGDTQEYLTLTLYGKEGQADTVSALSKGNDDLAQMFINDPDLLDASASAHFFSAVMDLTIVNNSFAADSAENTGMEVDVYEIIYTKTLDYNSPQQYITKAQVNTGQINGTVPSIILPNRGVTPFDFPDASSNGMRIIKKTKYFLGRGQTCTYQIRNPKNYKFRNSFIQDNDDNFAIRKITNTIMVVAKGVPTATPSGVTKRINIGCTRNYKYKIAKDQTDEDNYLP